MAETNLSEGEQTLRITVSLEDESTHGEEQQQSDTRPIFVDEARLLEVANLTTVVGERNTEHGLTPVRLVEFRQESQRQKIIHMLGESFSKVIEQLVPYLYMLAAHPKAAVRQRVAATVGELMCEVDFIHYKEAILIPWALSDNIYMNSSVGIALEMASQDPKYVDNLIALLKHWVTSPNRSFNWTALASCVQIGQLWPEETFEFLEVALKRDQLDLLTLAILVVRRLLQEGHAHLVLARLSEWISDRSTSVSLRKAAALIFLEAVKLSPLIDDGHLIDSAVDVFLVGLSDRKLAKSGAIRSAMLEKLKGWAVEAFDDPEKQAAMETLITRLHIRAETERDKERIVFQLRRWNRQDEEKRFAQVARGLIQ